MWSKEKIWKWYEEQPWIVGFNYVPSNAVNSTEMWQKESFDIRLIEKELSVAAKIGYNTCRVFLQYIVWKAEREAFYECFDAFLACAAKYGIRVMPILFDDCAFAMKEPYLGVQDEPVPGIHNSGWTPSPGFVYADSEEEQFLLREYVTDLVGRYREDNRILLWDLYNEPGNSDRKHKCIKLLRDIFEWARSCEPVQPLTSGIWIFEEFDNMCGELSDIISFHDYSNMEVTQKKVEKLECYERPIICTEWLNRPLKNCFENHMPYYYKKNIGIVNWGLVAGKTQTYLSNADISKNPKKGKPELWQHDIFHEDLTIYRTAEVELIESLTGIGKKVLQIPVQEMTPEIMDLLEQKGCIIRLCPSHHRFPVEPETGVGQDIYCSNESAGGHKLLAVGIDRTGFDAFGMHDENEEVLLLGGEEEKELYMLFGLYSWENLEEKRQKGILCSDDFVCLHCKFNDPKVSFFTICRGVLHGEATAGEGLPATFYVTESTGIRLDFFPWEYYKINLV